MSFKNCIFLAVFPTVWANMRTGLKFIPVEWDFMLKTNACIANQNGCR